MLLKDLKPNHPDILPYSKVDDSERNYRFWQRDPLPVLMDSKMKVEQKINYIHNTPLQQSREDTSQREERLGIHISNICRKTVTVLCQVCIPLAGVTPILSLRLSK